MMRVESATKAVEKKTSLDWPSNFGRLLRSNKKAPDSQGLTANNFGKHPFKMGDEGFEPPTSTV